MKPRVLSCKVFDPRVSIPRDSRKRLIARQIVISEFAGVGGLNQDKIEEASRLEEIHVRWPTSEVIQASVPPYQVPNFY